MIIALPRRFVALLSTLVLPVASSAATFSVNPTRVELDSHHRSDIVTLHNTGDTPLRMQARPMHWSMAADGKWELTPSDDLIVTPELVEIAPGASAQLRVGSLLDDAASEGSYRLLLNELPALTESKTQTSAQVRVLTEVNMPVFLEPAQAMRIPILQSAVVEHGALVVGIGDSGTKRLDPQNVHVTIKDHAGRVLDQRDMTANYVLPGSTWPLQVKLAAGICQRAASVVVSWPDIVDDPISHPITTGIEACEGKDSH